MVDTNKNREELISICCWLSGFAEELYAKMSDEDLEKEFQTLSERQQSGY